MKIGVIGAEKEGIAFSLICKKNGYDVMISDENEDLIFNLNQGVYLSNDNSVKKLLFESDPLETTTSIIDIIKHSDIIFVFVQTPLNIDGDYDTKNVFDVLKYFHNCSSLDIPLYDKKFVVCCSTNIGEVEEIQKRLSMFSIQVAYNPFFVYEDNAVKEIEESDIVLIGTEFESLSNDLINLYRKIQTKSINAFVMSTKASEMTKLSINSMVAYKLSYSNMIGDIATKMGFKSEMNLIFKAIGTDKRIGEKSLNYNFGFDGSHLYGDNKSLNHFIKKIEIDNSLIQGVEDFNESHLIFLKNYYLNLNPNKTVPFIVDELGLKKTNGLVENSKKYQLCVSLLEEGYTLNVIINEKPTKELNNLSESFNNKIKFFKSDAHLNGYKIKLN